VPAAINAAQRQFQQRRVAGRNAALERIAALYRIKAEIRDLNAAERHAPRGPRRCSAVWRIIVYFDTILIL
jgi:hypothetical protein